MGLKFSKIGDPDQTMWCLRCYVDSYWAGDISTIKTRYIERNKLDDQWQFYGHWAETRGNTTDKILYRTANMIRALNESRGLD